MYQQSYKNHSDWSCSKNATYVLQVPQAKISGDLLYLWNEQVFQIQSTSKDDVNILENISGSYGFHNISYNCAIQVLIASSEVDIAVIKPLIDLQNSKLDSTKVLYCVVCGLVKHRKRNNI